jgi:cellulose synthase/poly-beta-1,6-N-acetylglucosamine synthase-like glycosyltransferase
VVSIIIPLRSDTGYLLSCLQACAQASDSEIIVLPDQPLAHLPSSVRQLPTGPLSPAKKRNAGAAAAEGDYLAFIDDDTRPHPQWLAAALPHFVDPTVAAVGGPAVTPPEDPFWAQVGGAVYASWFFSGPARHRYVPATSRDVLDYPSCNLIVRRTIFEEVGGFRTDFWPGEDTAFCLDLIEHGYRIIYEPAATIDHHRRPHLRSHFRQLTNYAKHRGYFVKRFPRTSLIPAYFVPSLFLLTLLILSSAWLAGVMIAGHLLLLVLGLYLALALLSLVRDHPRLWLPGVVVIFLSHLAYGSYFLLGLASGRLPEEN